MKLNVFSKLNSRNNKKAMNYHKRNATLYPFKYELEGWDNPNNIQTNIQISDMNFVNSFGNWKYLKNKFPHLAKLIAKRAKSENYKGKMSLYVQKLINEGTYRLGVNNNGEIFPILVELDGTIVQLKIDEDKLNPVLFNSLMTLSNQAILYNILSEIRNIENIIKSVQQEIKNDRFALIDCASLQLRQADAIKNEQLKKQIILNAVEMATKAKCSFMRSYISQFKVLENEHKKSFKDMIKSSNISPSEIADDIISILISIMATVKLECNGYFKLKEFQAVQECLFQFQEFIENNNLTKRDTILKIGEGLANEQIAKIIVDDLYKISQNISQYGTITNITKNTLLFKGDELND